MVELFLIACIGLRTCEYLAVPQQFGTVAQCERQAALIAGMVRGRHATTDLFEYKAFCHEAGGPMFRLAEAPVYPGDAVSTR